MIDFLTSLYNDFLTFSNSNPVISGAFSLWGLTVLTYVCRNVPLAIFEFLKDQLTTSLTIDNTGRNVNYLNYNRFLSWASSLKGNHLSRRYKILNITWWDDEDIYSGEESIEHKKPVTQQRPKIGPDVNGIHFFMLNGRLYWFRITNIDSQGVEFQKAIVTITTFGRNKEKLSCLLNYFIPVKPKTEISVFNYESEWNFYSTFRKKPLSSVFLNAGVKEHIVGRLDFFFQNEAWFREKNFDYKESFLFHGKPGTGKTSLIKTLASHYDRDIYILNLSQLSGSGFLKALASIPKGSFLVVEDFEDCDAVTTRGKSVYDTDVLEENPESSKSDIKFASSLSLSVILNGLDGVISLDDIVIFFTTNHIEKIDAAVLRKNRINNIVELQYLNHDSVASFIRQYYPNEVIPDGIIFKDIAGCDLSDLFKEHNSHYPNFIKALKDHSKGKQ